MPFNKFVIIFIDNIIVLSKYEKENELHLRVVLENLWEYTLYAKYKSCHFLEKPVGFLGHVMSKEGINFDPTKVITVQELKPPINVTEIRNFLGLLGYYRHFIEKFSLLAPLLTNMTRNGV